MKRFLCLFSKLKSFAIAVVALVILIPTSHAAVIFHIWEDGPNLNFQASGSFDVGNEIAETALINFVNITVVEEPNAIVLFGESSETLVFSYFNEPPPPLVRTGLGVFGELNTVLGPSFGFALGNSSAIFPMHALHLGSDIVDGSSFLTTGSISSASLASTGIELGTFVWNLPTDTVTIITGQAPPTIPVPEPSLLFLLGLTFIALAWHKKGNISVRRNRTA